MPLRNTTLAIWFRPLLASKTNPDLATVSPAASGVTRGAQFPGRRMNGEGAEKSQQCQKYFNRVHLLPKDLRFEHWGAKLASCPGRHLTS